MSQTVKKTSETITVDFEEHSREIRFVIDRETLTLSNLNNTAVRFFESINALIPVDNFSLYHFFNRKHIQLFASSINDVCSLHKEIENTFTLTTQSERSITIITTLFPCKTSGHITHIGCSAFELTEIIQNKHAKQLADEEDNNAEKVSVIKEQFMAVISHEIRTPLNAIIGMTHLLQQNAPRKDQLSHLKTLRFSANNLLMLINDILFYSKIEAGEIRLDNNEFRIIDTVDTLRNTFLSKIEEKGLTLKVKIDSNIKTNYYGDPIRIGQILRKLMSNALKFTEAGSIEIRIDLIDDAAEDSILRFSVKDTGIGIPRKLHKQVLQHFTQGDSQHTRKYGGVGLGLAIVKKLLLLMHSKIEIESTIAEGSEFSFELKLRKSEHNDTSLPNSPSSIIEQGNLRGMKILFVEDSEINQFVAEQFLNQWNTKVHFAFNGEEAVDKVKHNHYDIILMDVQMPVMNGYEASKSIRQFNTYKNIPIIALTALTYSQVKDKLKTSGINDYLAKPFNPVELYNKIIEWTHIPVKPLKQQNLLDIENTNPSANITKQQLIKVDNIRKLTNNNAEFLKRFLCTTEKAFRELSANFKEAVNQTDYEKLRATIHKITPAVIILGFTNLKKELDESKVYFQQGNKAKLEDSIKKVDKYCNDLIVFLNENFKSEIK